MAVRRARGQPATSVVDVVDELQPHLSPMSSKCSKTLEIKFQQHSKKWGRSGWLSKPKFFVATWRKIFIFSILFLVFQLYLAIKLDVLSFKRVENRKTDPVTVSLNLQDISFEVPCEPKSYEAIFAINRAKSQECKQKIFKTTCLLNVNQLFPLRLNRTDCILHNSGGSGNGEKVYLGCFQDSKESRLFPEHVISNEANNSKALCYEQCIMYGYPYFGLQYGKQCFCGLNSPPAASKLAEERCNFKCSSNNGEICGGYFAMSVFEANVPKSTDKDSNSALTNIASHKDINIVFFLQLNGRALRQVKRLIKALFHKNHYFLIHVDSRQDYLYRELKFVERLVPNNIKFVSKRRATIWGGASLLQVILDAIQDLNENSSRWGWKWDYFINLSESDFPLKNVSMLETYLKAHQGKNFLRSHGKDGKKFISKQGLDRVFVECDHRMWRTGKRALIEGVIFDGGSDWIGIHESFARYIVTTNDTLVSELRRFFEYALLPAESFFHTVLKNSKFCNTWIDNNLRVTNWKRKLGCKCQYKDVVDWCGCSPNDFRVTDWNKLKNTEVRDIFFGRKFEAVISQSIINQVENWILPDRNVASNSIASYWESLYHYLDISPKPDDSLLSLAGQMAVTTMNEFCNENCELDSSFYVRLLEISLRTANDVPENLLVRFESSLSHRNDGGSSSVVELEACFSSKRKVRSSRSPSLQEILDRIKDVRIGSNYDQKEQVFRNHFSIVGPYNDPVILFSIISEKSFNISLQWLDPKGSLSLVTDTILPEGTKAHFVKPNFNKPLYPGMWTVEVYYKKEKMLSVYFGVFPLSYIEGRKIYHHDASSKINGISVNHTGEIENIEKELLSSFYQLQSQCWVYGPEAILSEENEKCTETPWSSLYPDPKSEIRGLDAVSGQLIP